MQFPIIHWPQQCSIFSYTNRHSLQLHTTPCTYHRHRHHHHPQPHLHSHNHVCEQQQQRHYEINYFPLKLSCAKESSSERQFSASSAHINNINFIFSIYLNQPTKTPVIYAWNLILFHFIFRVKETTNQQKKIKTRPAG